MAKIASEMYADERLCYAAAAKPLLTQALPSFDEKALGYESFRAFLKDAEAKGQVQLLLAKGGDVEVLPAGASVPVSGAPIRRDLWTAVTSRSEKYRYLPDVDRVVSDDHDGEGVPLPVAGEARQLEWAEQFVASLDPEQAPELVKRFEAAETARQKFLLLVEDADVRRAWNRMRTQHVTKLLEEWRAENHLRLALQEPSRRRPRRPSDRPHQAASSRDDLVRRRLHAAIDRMPLADLLRISLPVEYTVEL